MKLTFLPVLLLLSTGCSQMSESVMDDKTGLNGGFETVVNSLPVNWLVYTEKTIGNGDFDILPDSEDVREGKKSLRFTVRECSAQGGRFSPGVAREMDAVAGSVYRLSIQVKNEGTLYRISAGGVTGETGEVKLLIETSETNSTWTILTFDVPVSADYSRLRFEISILSPGTLRVDDLQVMKVE
ncbi:MAG: hypothetical protein J0L62_05825 [Bacteroidetes bacterium]|nr:hypothetical protein [Bacteroidota bacterium]